ncbi:MAG: hypothetical protein V3U71_09110 [Cocleimonas sp.]
MQKKILQGLKHTTPEAVTTNIIIHSQKKPQWVTDEVVRIKALMPHASCRIISLVFNQHFGNRESVGKTLLVTPFDKICMKYRYYERRSKLALLTPFLSIKSGKST